MRGTFYAHAVGPVQFRHASGCAKVELYVCDLTGWRLIKDAQYVQSGPNPETRTVEFLKKIVGYSNCKLRLITSGSKRRDETNPGTAANSGVTFQPEVIVTTSNMPILE